MATPKVDEHGVTTRLLQQEIAALRHELRRVRDGLERNPRHELEARAKQLNKNIELCEQDLAQALKAQSSAE